MTRSRSPSVDDPFANACCAAAGCLNKATIIHADVALCGRHALEQLELAEQDRPTDRVAETLSN